MRVKNFSFSFSDEKNELVLKIDNKIILYNKEPNDQNHEEVVFLKNSK